MMATGVSLRKILEGMNWQSDESTAYRNTKTGDVVAVSDEDLAVAETGDDLGGRAEWEAEAIRNRACRADWARLYRSS